MTEAVNYLDGPGCGTASHDEDCLCDLTMPAGPPAPAGNVPLALAELREIHGPAVASLAETVLGEQAITDYRLAISEHPTRTSGSTVIHRLLSAGQTIAEAARTLGISEAEAHRKLTKNDTLIPQLLRTDTAIRNHPTGERILWSEMARALDVPVDYVWRWGKLIGRDNTEVGKRPGFKATNHSDEAWAKAKQLYLDGVALRKIQATTGIPRNTLSTIASRNNWPKPQRCHGATPEQWAKAKAAVQAGRSQQEASEASGIPKSTIADRSRTERWVAA